jgi:hypothetical protein
MAPPARTTRPRYPTGKAADVRLQARQPRSSVFLLFSLIASCGHTEAEKRATKEVERKEAAADTSNPDHFLASPWLPEQECASRLVFCIDVNGLALPGERDPRVGPGETLTVDVVDRRSSLLPGQVLRLEASSGSAPYTRIVEDLKSSSSGTAGLPPGDAGADALPPAAATDAGVIADASVTPSDAGGSAETRVPTDRMTEAKELLGQIHIDDIQQGTRLIVKFRRYENASLTSALLAERELPFDIGANGYYFEPTFMFPTTFNGERVIAPVSTADGRFSVVHAKQSNIGALENVSLGVNIYPFGYPPSKCPYPTSGYGFSTWIPFVCHPKLLAKPVVLQVGTSISHDAFREYFIGGGYSVVRGVTVSVGAAFVRGDFFGPTLFEGQVVPTGALLPSHAVEQKYMIRPYFSVSLSPDILSSALQVLNQAKTLAPSRPPE